MSARSQFTLRTSLSRLAVAGAATLASVFTLAPAAVADGEAMTTQPPEAAEQAPPQATDEPAPTEEPTEQVPTEETAPAEEPTEQTPTEDPGSLELRPAKPAQTSPSARADLAAAEPTYGPQSFRVGAKIASGAYSPSDSAAGSEFTIYYTDADGVETNETCTATGAPDVDGVVYCPTTYTAPAGAYVTVHQSSAPTGLLADYYSQSLQPCDLDETDPCPSADLVFTATGLPPTAMKDKRNTDANTSVIVDVLGNDDNADSATTMTLGSTPAYGTAGIVTVDGRQQIEYTPNPGVTDTLDHFDYTLTNPNGSSTAAVTIAIGDVAPNYGTQKYYVGVQVADGSYVPDGTTTEGSEFLITTTAINGAKTEVTCLTSVTYCGGDSPYHHGFYAPPGSTVTVVQTKAAPGLTPSTETKILPPCDRDVDVCFDTDLVFTNTGPVPDTTGDHATTREGEPVRIDVLGNDDSGDPDTTLSVDTGPDHGTAEVVGSAGVGASASARVLAGAVPSAGTLAIRYTPAAGFVGTDTFKYAVTNSNGTTIETVTISVLADPPDAADPGGHADTDGAADTDDNAALPDTGGADARLLGVAGLLLASGAWLTAAGRRRRSGVHAG